MVPAELKSRNLEIVAEVLKEFAAAESCADALARTLADSESEMSSAVLVRSFQRVLIAVARSSFT